MTERKATPLWESTIVKRALVDALGKLDPRIQARNIFTGQSGLIAFELQIAIWLWFTVLFANFAEAMAEGRGKAQADNLRKTRTETQAKLMVAGGETKLVPAAQLRRDDVVMVAAGDVIPGDGEVIEGIAAVNEAAITGESAPVIR